MTESVTIAKLMPAATHLAAVLACNPIDLLEAVGERLRSVGDPRAAEQQHPDVVSIEAIANVLFLTNLTFDGLVELDLEHSEARDILLVTQIEHVRTCRDCRANLDQLERIRPSQKAVSP
jgi:hypothetical protein